MRVLTLVLTPALALGACAPSAPPPTPAPDTTVAYTLVPTAYGVEIPVPTLPARPEVTRVIQDDLAGRVDGSSCEDDENGYFEPTVTVPLAEADVFSVEIHVSYFCGGPYPTNDDNRSATYDLRSGRPVPFGALFRDAERDAGAIRTAYLAAAGTPAVADCADLLTDDTLQNYGFTYALAPDGVILQPVFPHAIEACADRAVVPFARLDGLLAPDGVAARVMTSRDDS